MSPREHFLNSCLHCAMKTDHHEEPCPICLQDYDLTPVTAVWADTVEEDSHILCEIRSCGHRFGFSCLSTWAKQHNTCPMCREPTYPRDKEEETPNRSMFLEHSIGDLPHIDEEDLDDLWSMEGYPASTNDIDDLDTEGDAISDSFSLALALQSFELAIESDDDTDEGESDRVTEAVREYEELHRSNRERLG